VTEVGRYLDATLEAVLLNAAESRSQSQTPPAPAIPTATIGVVFYCWRGANATVRRQIVLGPARAVAQCRRDEVV
jgi:hypothetical protein